MANIRLTLSGDLLEALRSGGSVTLHVEASPVRGRKLRRSPWGSHAPRVGSLGARVLAWAAKRRTPFRPVDVEKRFNVSRAHAATILSQLTRAPNPLERIAQARYEFRGGKGGASHVITRVVHARPGTLGFRVVNWAAKHVLLCRLTDGPAAIERCYRGVYRYR